MADGPTQLPGSWFWGIISAAAEQHATTEQVWQRIRDEVARVNAVAPEGVQYTWSSDIWGQINSLRGNASSVVSAADRLNRAPATDALEGTYISRPFWGRDQSAFDALNQWQGRIAVTMQTDAGQYTQWLTRQYDAGTLPGSVGALADDLSTFALSRADAYPGKLVATGDIQLLQV